ncbi:uncharacterized protein B0I36DRAFT_388617 [Microdochium trichocladiopsis]|uniref:Zn(2)-C6 fungal-type domain-containing protein n=1 Tax=Microdochium trichocladiopsis TaxID=1682393 RepID=A0A9P8XUK1_9PEZI|nr:uncharacterized protein B0I36DRAFT_388617 [Microdochium trichocladiopsis]KAH7018397.1 hypothetical protein B0I36DRAFT_388617 [Microdochium trichocladiopsis]
MVFGGRFNTACHLCRKRRVKCDEGRPGCRRCAVYGKPCPGYSDTFHFAHQAGTDQPQPQRHQQQQRHQHQRQSPDVTIWASRHAASGSAASSTLGVSATGAAIAPAGHFYHAAPVLPPALDPPEEITSLYYFMNRFASRAECAGLPGYLNFLFSLYDPGRSDALELATLSAARMVAYNRTRHSDKSLRDKSYRDHGLAVAKIRKLLTDEARISKQQKQNGSKEAPCATEATREALSDRTLGTVLLLSIFGLVNDAASRHAGSHASGVYYLLTRRGPEQGFTSRGRELMFLSMVYLQADAAVRNDFKYCDFASMGILPQGSQILDPMTRVVPILELLCQKSKPLRTLLEPSDFIAMFSRGSSPSTQQGDSPCFDGDRSNGYIPNGVPSIARTNSTTTTINATDTPLPTRLGTPGSASTLFSCPSSPQKHHLDDRLTQIQVACSALDEFEAWNKHATATWPHFYGGRGGPPLLGQSAAHAWMYHSETASTVVLMRSYRVRFSLLLLAVCQQTIKDATSASTWPGVATAGGSWLTAPAVSVSLPVAGGHDGGFELTHKGRASPSPTPAPPTVTPMVAGSVDGDNHYTHHDSSSSVAFSSPGQTPARPAAGNDADYTAEAALSSPSCSALSSSSPHPLLHDSMIYHGSRRPSIDNELLGLAIQTAAKLEHEIRLAIADMVHCIPFVLDPTTPSSYYSSTSPSSSSLPSPLPPSSSSHASPRSPPPPPPARPPLPPMINLASLESQPAQKGFELRDPLRLIATCPLATPEQRRLSRVNLKRVHEIAGMREPPLPPPLPLLPLLSEDEDSHDGQWARGLTF